MSSFQYNQTPQLPTTAGFRADANGEVGTASFFLFLSGFGLLLLAVASSLSIGHVILLHKRNAIVSPPD
jgi:hypothetical protein